MDLEQLIQVQLRNLCLTCMLILIQVPTVVKNLPANAGDARDVDSILGQKNPLKEEMATHSSILAWRIQWTQEPGGLQSMGSQSWTWLSTQARFWGLIDNILKLLAYVLGPLIKLDQEEGTKVGKGCETVRGREKFRRENHKNKTMRNKKGRQAIHSLWCEGNIWYWEDSRTNFSIKRKMGVTMSGITINVL